MNRLEVQMCLIDHEINQLVSKKNLIDIRLTELYEQREDLVTEWYNQEALVKHNDGTYEQMTIEEVLKEMENNNGDI